MKKSATAQVLPSNDSVADEMSGRRLVSGTIWIPRVVNQSEEPSDMSAAASRLFANLGLLAQNGMALVVAAPSTSLPAPGERAAIIGEHVIVVVPIIDRDLIVRAQAAVPTACRRGIAVAPDDGVDPAALVEAARAACDRAVPGENARASAAVDQLTLGGRVAVVGDVSTARMFMLARRLAGSTLPVTITGPTGSGKDLVAAAIHHHSPRAHHPFVAVNCAAIPDSLAEAELFGHAKGAFTGAVAARAGLIEASRGGTLFLDEVAELSPSTQARLLRVLESGEVVRVGETTPRPIDLRVVVATHRDLAVEVAAGRFRKDLWYRLGVARIDVAPLAHRPRDLAALIQRFAAEACVRFARHLAFAPATIRTLLAHDWPGNVRELRHAIEFAVAAAVANDAATIEPAHLPALRCEGATLEPRPEPRGTLSAQISIAAEVRALERRRMVEALATCDGAQNKAAALIQMPLRSFVTKLKRYAISERDWQP